MCCAPPWAAVKGAGWSPEPSSSRPVGLVSRGCAPGGWGPGHLPGQASAGGEQRKPPSPSAAPPVLALRLRPGRWRQRRGAGRRDPRASRAAAAAAPWVVDAAARLAWP